MSLTHAFIRLTVIAVLLTALNCETIKQRCRVIADTICEGVE